MSCVSGVVVKSSCLVGILLENREWLFWRRMKWVVVLPTSMHKMDFMGVGK